MARGQAPAAPLKCRRLRLMLCSYPARFQLAGKEGSAGAGVLTRLRLSQNKMWCFYMMAGAAGGGCDVAPSVSGVSEIFA